MSIALWKSVANETARLVGEMPRPDFTNKASPTSNSSLRMALLTAGWLTPRISAAFVND